MCRSKAKITPIVYGISFIYPDSDPIESKKRINYIWEKIETYFEAHKYRPKMVSELSKAVKLSERSPSRLFNDRFTISPKEYLHRLRFNGVKRGIEQTLLKKKI